MLSDAVSRSRPAPDSMADRDLAQRASRGDQAARREMARRLLDRARVTVRYLVGDSPDAPDLVQSGLLEVLRSTHTFRGESRLETWADRIVTRTALRIVKQRRQRPETAVEEVAEALVERTHAGSELDRERVRRRMAALLQKIGDERRLVLVLHVVLGHSVPEIAAMTDTREHTVWDRLKVGKKKLRKLILTDDLLREWVVGERS